MEEGTKSSSGVYQYSRRNLFFAAIVAGYLFTGVGMFMGWSSPALVTLPIAKGENLTTSESTMIVSLPGLAPGPLITMFGLDLIGRKWSIFLIWTSLMICWAMMDITLQVTALMVARFIGGWSLGAASNVISIYISEISDVGVRATLTSAAMVLLTGGLIIVQAAGPFITFASLSALCTVVTGMFILFFWFLPESPYFLVKRGHMDRANASLAWLRRGASASQVQRELDQIQYCIEEERKTKVGIKKMFTSKTVLKQLCIAWYLLFLQQATGLTAVLSYSQTIFIQAEVKVDAAYVPIFLNVLFFIGGLTSPYFIKKLGNRYCIPISTVGVGIGDVVTAIYFFCKESGIEVTSYSWVPIASISFSFCICAIGLTGAVLSVVADIFPPSVKGYATGISGIFSVLLGFCINTIFGFATEKYGFGVVFLGFGLTSLISSVGLFFIPEFTRMTLQEIQDYFEGKNKKGDKTIS